MNLLDLLPDRFVMMTIKDILTWGSYIVIFTMTIMEFMKKIPWNPWSSVIKWLGTRFNSELIIKINDLSISQKELRDDLNADKEQLREFKENVHDRFREFEQRDAEKEAEVFRHNIRVFADGCRAGTRHTKAEFAKVFTEIDNYHTHCKKHDLINHQIDEEVWYIKEVYHACSIENSFL